MRKHVGGMAIMMLALLVAGTASADMITFDASGSGVGNNPLSAQAVFEITGNTLTVTLTNTSAAYTEIPSEILTGLYFDWAGDPTLTTVSAILNAGSAITLGGPTGPGGDVGGEYAYLDNISSGFNGASYGISSSGMDDLFGPGDRFNGNNLQGPNSPDGMQYGIVSAGGLGPGAVNPMTDGSNYLVQNSVVFTFTFDGQLDLNSIGNVSFQYGTSQDQPNIVVPEPTTMTLLGLGIAGMAFGRLRRKKS